MVFQFQVDGRAAGPIRARWEDAAQDAVNDGYAVWVGDEQIRMNDQCSIARGYTDDELKN